MVGQETTLILETISWFYQSSLFLEVSSEEERSEDGPYRSNDVKTFLCYFFVLQHRNPLLVHRYLSNRKKEKK